MTDEYDIIAAQTTVPVSLPTGATTDTMLIEFWSLGG